MNRLSSVTSAISVTSSLIAIYSPSPSIASESNSQRVVVKCYDSKVSLGSLKFTLTATLPGNDDVTGVVGIRQLVFCGYNDAYLIATLSSSNNK